MSERRALILANGDLGDPTSLRPRLQFLSFDIVIAADGGTRHATALGRAVDLVVGDLDSLPEDDRARWSQGGAASFTPAEKTKPTWSWRYSKRRRGAMDVVVVGAVGGRYMTLANVGLMLHPPCKDHST
jgi:thiamine pyrophosphokinase